VFNWLVVLTPLIIAQTIVSSKIRSMEKVFQEKLNKFVILSSKTKDIQELMGVEGKATSIMFKKFRQYLEISGINDFKKREYRPTKDKVNGLLSFTYTLYSNLLYSLILSDGYDPYIGFLHSKRGMHAAFVSDMIEFDRARLTLFVLKLFTHEYLVDDDFESIYLTQNGRKKFLVKFNELVAEIFDDSRKNLNFIGDRFV